MNIQKQHVAFIVFAILAITTIFFAYQCIVFSSEIFHLQGILEQKDSQIGALEQKQSELQKNISIANIELSSANSLLGQKTNQISSLEQQLEDANSNIAQKQIELNKYNLQVSQIQDELTSMQEEINSSMQWFKQNSILPKNYSWALDIFQKRIIDECIYKGELNLACINYLTDRTALQIKYKSDIEAGSQDHLQSLEQTIKREGGDCEDYSLFIKAVLNYIKSQNQDVQIKSWEEGDSKFIVWPQNPTSGTYSYYPNSQKKLIGNLQSSYPYVICYSVDSASGHCRIAISQNKINSTSQISLLEGANIFEPQNGRYTGVIGCEYQICTSNQQTCYANANSIVIIISDSDIYEVKGGNWTSYSKLYDESNTLLQNFLKN